MKENPLQYQIRGTPVPTTRTRGTNYPESTFKVPTFDKKSREILIELGRLIWQDINPNIFGSMFQAVVQSGSRSELGQHYTSVPNTLKTIEPLFLDELKEAFDAAYDSVSGLKKLRDRIGKIKIFEPKTSDLIRPAVAT